MMQKIKKRWKAKTSKTVKFLQVTLSAIATVALYYAGLPEEWKATIPIVIIQVTAFLGYFITLILQFTKKKTA